MPEENVTPVEETTDQQSTEVEMNDVLPEVEITIFTTPDCTKCRFVKDYLTQKHITFTEKDAIQYADEVADTGFQSAPIFKIVEGDVGHFIGDVDEFIREIENNGLGVQE